ncbi:hypothetical protein [Cryptosporangium aurantiacum]|uniref:Uncharacterized protein n=1 Tax=Cryptosporangium aurantiacum TaxID=134849 RepID=A0A1M7NI06_9ACTN|nr:hypothetical protein [Cryptosporangium aurantiacum]SHN03415.1 hypothetical protein SAMN05443668_102645 [Cryptosporangium aurantiacum]
MADRDDEMRASLQALRDFGAKVKDAGHQDLNGFANIGTQMSQAVLGFTGTGTGSGTYPVAPLSEAVYFGNLMAGYSQAAGQLAGDVVLGLSALGFAAEGIATQYGDGDALSSTTIDNVADAFVPRPGDPTPQTQETSTDESRKDEKAPEDPDGHHSGAPERGERPTLPGGGPDVPDAKSDEYKPRPFQL